MQPPKPTRMTLVLSDGQGSTTEFATLPPSVLALFTNLPSMPRRGAPPNTVYIPTISG